MNKRMLKVPVLCAMFLGLAMSVEAGEPIRLKVLYASDVKSDRTKDFQVFLRSHFTTVGIAGYLQFNDSLASKYDVIVLDWPDLPPRDKQGFLKLNLSKSYDRPTVLIGGGTLAIGRDRQLKLDDLCVCLGDAAHNLDETHPIFRSPFTVRPSKSERQTPSYYRAWPGGEKLPETLSVWRVQKRGWSIDTPADFSYLPGMVSDPCGFTDSPDTEVIAGGLNTKSPDAVAIGRHGNFLLWGFYSPPSDLTDEARQCLVNAICYIRNFDGHSPLVRKRDGRTSRDWALVYAYSFAELVRQRPPEPSAAPKLEGKDPTEAARKHRERVERFRQIFPADVQKTFGHNAELYIKYYRDNLEFLRTLGDGAFPFVVDDEVKRLGLSNRRIALLDRCVGMLESGEQTALASRILERYTREKFANAKGWRAWLDTNRDYLFFTDIGGYQFMRSPQMTSSGSTARDPLKAARLRTSEPDARNPVVASAAIVCDFDKSSGEDATLVVRIKTAPTWHIYAMDRSKGPGTPTSIRLHLPQGVRADGDWICPDASPTPDGQMSHAGTFEFRRRLKLSKSNALSQSRPLCTLEYQACTVGACEVPISSMLVTHFEEGRDGKD